MPRAVVGTQVTTHDVARRAAEIPFWFHSLDLGDGIVTPGVKSAAALAAEEQKLELPAFEGKTVLDIGAWDGYYSFAAERRGAASVTALDSFTWGMDRAQTDAFVASCRQRGMAAPDLLKVPGLIDLEGLPGKRGFDLVRAAYGSKVRSVVADFMTADLDALGTFDVVLFLGVLYHLQNPLLALERLASVTREVAVIESHAWRFDASDRAMVEFYEGDELSRDFTNWWAPNERALVGMCRAAGFRSVDVKVKPPLGQPINVARRLLRKPIPYRIVVHAHK